MDLRIFPSVAKIGLIRVQKNDAALASKDKCLRFLSIVCMDFGNSFIQFKGVVEEKGAAPQGFKGGVRIKLFDQRPDTHENIRGASNSRFR